MIKILTFLALLFYSFNQEASCTPSAEHYDAKPHSYSSSSRIIPKTPAEQLMYSTVRIETQCGEREEIGTGFIFNFGKINGVSSDTDVLCLITNRHVLDKASWASFTFHTPVPRVFEPSGQSKKITVENFSSKLILHPDPDIDLCGYLLDDILLSQGQEAIKSYTWSISSASFPPEEEIPYIGPVQDIVMVGYPAGLYDTVNNFPIMRKGTTASHFAVDFNGKPEFLIDAACFKGSSGSPVFLYKSGAYVDYRTRSITVGSEKWFFLGILHEGPNLLLEGKITAKNIPMAHTPIPISETSIMIHLGNVIKFTELEEIRSGIQRRVDEDLQRSHALSRSMPSATKLAYSISKEERKLITVDDLEKMIPGINLSDEKPRELNSPKTVISQDKGKDKEEDTYKHTKMNDRDKDKSIHIDITEATAINPTQQPLQALEESFETLPPEILRSIFIHLNNPEDFRRLKGVCRRFKGVVEEYFMETINPLNKQVYFLKERGKYIYILGIKKPMLSISGWALSKKEVNKISKFIKKSTTLKCLSLRNTEIDEYLIDTLVDGLKHNRHITLLDLSYNKLGDKGVKVLSSFIEKSPQLISLNLSHNNIEYQGIQEISTALKGKQIASLDLSHNSLVDGDLSALISAVEYHDTLIDELNLSGCDLTRNAGEYISRLLKHNSIHSLNISDNNFTNNIMDAIGRPLSLNTTLKCLILEKNSIGSSSENLDMYYQLQYLRKNTTLITLSLANNQFGNEDAVALASMLKENRGLRHLNLSNNKITNEGADFIALSLKYNTTLAELNLSGNNITSGSLNEFSKVIKAHNRTLKSIYLSENIENSSSIEELKHILRGGKLLSVREALKNVGVDGILWSPEQEVTFKTEKVRLLLQGHMPLPLTKNSKKLATILLNEEMRLRLAAELGDRNAQYKIASRILDDDTEVSKKYIFRAAAQGHPDALYDLSVAYETAPYYFGLGERDSKLAHSLCEEAVEFKHKEAELSLALAYLEGGYGMEINEEKGMSMLHRLRAEGNDLAKDALRALEETSEEEEDSEAEQETSENDLDDLG